MINYNLDIDLNSYSDKVLCTLQQGEDGGRGIQFHVMQNGADYTPLAATTDQFICKLQIDKPDGTTIITSTTDKITDHNHIRIKSTTPLILNYTVGKNTCAVEGILHCKLSILQGNSASSTTTLKSVLFKMRVEAGVKREEDVVSSSEYERFEDFIGKIDTFEEKVTQYENHVTNKLNPHQVTASQVGTYTSQEIDNKIRDVTNSPNFADGRIYSRSSVNMNRKADTTVGNSSFSFGRNNEASGDCSHAEGEESIASGAWAHAEGAVSKATAQCSHSEGNNTTASGYASHAEGIETVASGIDSHSEGSYTIASEQDSHAEGQNTKAEGAACHAEGCSTTASGVSSHAEGYRSSATGDHAHSEGKDSVASGNHSHAEGEHTTASGPNSHAEGYRTLASGLYSHTEGHETTASKANSHAEGWGSIASGQDSHAEGQSTKAEAFSSHAEGKSTTASGEYSHAEGNNTTSIGESSHAEGTHTTSSGQYSHAEGLSTTASGDGSHAEGTETKASGSDSHAEGFQTIASEANSHAEGWGSIASGQDSHAEGQSTKAEAFSSHAEGKSTTASGEYSHAEGQDSTAAGDSSHAEGFGTTSLAQCSHAEGNYTSTEGHSSHAEGSFSTASGSNSHAEGEETIAKGTNSHAEGRETITGETCSCQHVQGKYNIEDTEGKYADIIGGGTSNSDRKNISTLDWEGNLYLSGDIYVNGDKENSLSHLTGNAVTYNLSKSGSTIKLTGSDGSESTVMDTDTTYTAATPSTNGLMTSEMVTKLNNISADANNYTLPAAASSILGGIKTGYNNNGKNYKVQLDSNHNAFVNVPWENSSGDIDTNAYALKSIYGDTTINLGRELNSTIGERSCAVGFINSASGQYSFAEGRGNYSKGEASHAEGYGNISEGLASHAEGRSCKATYNYAHAEGYACTSSAYGSHAEGDGCKASGSNSHAEGNSCISTGYGSHSEGSHTYTSNPASHAEGYYTRAITIGSHASGKYNKEMKGQTFEEDNQTADCFVVGNGTSDTARSNAFRVTYSGEVYGTSAFKSSGADYAEFIKPWHDNNEQNEDRVGYFVTVKNGLLHKANEGDLIAGITSGCPSVVGNADEDYYWRWERDEFNRVIMEDILETIEKTDENGNVIYDEKTNQPIKIETGNILKNAKMKQSANYDPSRQNTYVERKDRREWDYVGMIGVLPVRDDGTCIAGHLCKCGTGGIATYAYKRDFDTYMVIERINDHIISVILK